MQKSKNLGCSNEALKWRNLLLYFCWSKFCENYNKYSILAVIQNFPKLNCRPSIYVHPVACPEIFLGGRGGFLGVIANFAKKFAFFSAGAPTPPPSSKLVILAPLLKFWGCSAKNGCRKIISRGTLKKIELKH